MSHAHIPNASAVSLATVGKSDIATFRNAIIYKEYNADGLHDVSADVVQMLSGTRRGLASRSL